MKRLSIAIIFICIGMLGTNIGLSILFKAIGYLAPIEYSELKGSLFSNHITIAKLQYSTSSDSSIVFHSIDIQGINILRRTLSQASIQSIDMPIQSLSLFKSNGESFFSFDCKRIFIKQLNIKTHPLTKPIKLTQIKISNESTPTMSFYFEKKPYSLSLEKHNFDKAFVLKLMTNGFLISLLGYIDDDGFYFDSTPNSNLKNFHVRYSQENQSLGLYVDHEEKDQVLKGNAKFSDQTAVINIDIFDWESPFHNIDIHGSIDTKKNNYDFDASYNNSHIKATLLNNGTLISSGHLEEIAFLTPYAEGACDFNLELNPNRTALYVHANTLTLPVSKISDVQITYDTKNKRYLNISAAQLRNPLILLTDPSLSLQTTKQGDKVNFLAFYQGQLQQVSSDISYNFPRTEVTIDKFLLQNDHGENWSISSSPITITEQLLTLPKTSINYKDQSVILEGYYNRLNFDWALHHTFNNAQISFNSQGVIDADTEVNIKHAVLNGKATLAAAPKSPAKLTGYYDLSNISASLMNITPKFVFPLDLELQNSHIYWKDGELDAELYSTQGNIIIEHQSNGHHISTQDISFSHHKNLVQGSAELNYSHDNALTGQLKIKEANLVLNPDESFESFPKDIDIIGKVSTAKPGTSNIDINLELSIHEKPVYLFGFKGIADGDLTIQAIGNKPMLVTGDIALHDPSLTLLNRSIALEALDISYNQQPWLKGSLNLSLEKSVTVSSASTKVSNTDIKLTAFGPVDSPSFTITSIPVPVSQFEAFTYIFSTSKQLPQGHENFALLEAISGLKRNQGIVVLLQALNQVSKIFVFDITFRPEYNQKQTFSDDFIKSDLTLSKQIYEKVWIIVRRQLNEENANFAMNYKINPWLSSELQYNRNANILAASLFYRN